MDSAQPDEETSPDAVHSQSTYRKGVEMEALIISSNGQSPLDFRIQTRSKTRNLMSFVEFLSSIEPKNVKEAINDTDWVNSMQKELFQFERSKFGIWS